MKRHLLKLAVIFGVLALAAQAQALVITPTTDSPLTGPETSQSDIDDAIASTLGSSTELYKQDVGGSESGSLAGSYETTFSNTEQDPSDALIEYVGGDIVGPTAFLLIKDGNQDPAWYLFNLTDLGWTGVEDLELSGFWPDQGAISHVALYGGTTTVPEPGTLLLLGSGLIGLALFGRKSFKR
jgi:hypothetical protein